MNNILLELEKFHCTDKWKFCKNFANIRNDNYGLLLVNNIDYFIDIGSCLGEVAFAAQKLYNPIKTIAVEASCETFECLYKNIGSLPNTIAYNRAIHSEKNRLLTIIKNPKNIGQNAVDYRISEPNNQVVQSITIDEIFELNKISTRSSIFLKIDCEGSEKHILNNPLILSCKQISLEVHERDPEVAAECEIFYRKILETHKIIKGKRYPHKNYEIVFQKQ